MEKKNENKILVGWYILLICMMFYSCIHATLSGMGDATVLIICVLASNTIFLGYILLDGMLNYNNSNLSNMGAISRRLTNKEIDTLNKYRYQ